MSELLSPHRHAPSSLPRIDGDRAVFEQAKGALMLRHGIGAHEAFALRLTWARDSDTTLNTIAHTLVGSVVRQGDEAQHHEPALVRWLQERLSEDIPANP
jgi:hypothetical protein